MLQDQTPLLRERHFHCTASRGEWALEPLQPMNLSPISWHHARTTYAVVLDANSDPTRLARSTTDRRSGDTIGLRIFRPGGQVSGKSAFAAWTRFTSLKATSILLYHLPSNFLPEPCASRKIKNPEPCLINNHFPSSLLLSESLGLPDRKSPETDSPTMGSSSKDADKKLRKEKKELDKADKAKKDKKRSESEGVSKDKKDKKKDKAKQDKLARALDAHLQADVAAEAGVQIETAAVDPEDLIKPSENLVPFAMPLADDKMHKKAYKLIKKGMHSPRFTFLSTSTLIPFPSKLFEKVA